MGGAMAALETFEAGRHRGEKNMLKKLQAGSFRSSSFEAAVSWRAAAF